VQHARERSVLFSVIRSLFRGTEHRSTSQFGDASGRIDRPVARWPRANNLISITPEVALTCAPVFSCHKVISETIAELPLKLYRTRPDGGRDPAEDHPLFWLLADAPNDWTPISEFKLAMTSRWCLDGNAYTFASRNLDGVIEEIVQIEGGRTSLRCDPMTGEPLYDVTDRSGDRKTFSREAVVHVRGFGPSPLLGLSPIEQGREAIALALIMERHAAGLFGNGAKPSGAITHPKTLGDTTIKKLREQLNSRAGSDNPGGTLILEEGMNWVQFMLSSTDAQFLELRKFAVQEVCRLWRRCTWSAILTARRTATPKSWGSNSYRFACCRSFGSGRTRSRLPVLPLKSARRCSSNS
jgi:HK97 family phage portal protein